MKIVISPAKTLDFETKPKTSKFTEPQFLKDSRYLVQRLKKLKAEEIGKLMSISEKLSELNADRFKAWETPFTPDNAKQAILAFKGDVYEGLQAWEFEEKDFAAAQEKLRILSGLYGLLKPLDLIQPYRLEMGTSFSTEKGKNLYEYWSKKVTAGLNKELKADETPLLINLASNEYFGAIDKKKLNADIFTPVFKDEKNGKFKIISFFAKKARGAMSSFIIKNNINEIDKLKTFNWNEYYFEDENPKTKELIFHRKEQ